MASPFAAYGRTFFSVEYRVNGIWCSLLNQHFPPTPNFAVDDYLISPEAYPMKEDTSGKRADLLVNKIAAAGSGGGMTISKPVLVFEGKGADGDALDKADDQLEIWLAHAATIAKFNCWVIAARGPLVKFWHWKGDSLLEIKWDGHIKIYDITNAGDWANVSAILAYMAGEPA